MVPNGFLANLQYLGIGLRTQMAVQLNDFHYLFYIFDIHITTTESFWNHRFSVGFDTDWVDQQHHWPPASSFYIGGCNTQECVELSLFLLPFSNAVTHTCFNKHKTVNELFLKCTLNLSV
uniref:Uncharacterized protein n=1 Tax=Lepeophtheirus salmonis TaxID=72036 RepID=A0A0K2T3C6_LEPSM